MVVSCSLFLRLIPCSINPDPLLCLSLLSLALHLSLSQADRQTNKRADRGTDRQTDSSVVYFWRGKVILRCYLVGLLPDRMSESGKQQNLLL